MCAGGHHYEAVPLSDALDAYNDIGNLQWACKRCNSSKGGEKGRYENIPKHIGECPGGNCGAHGVTAPAQESEVDEKGADASDDIEVDEEAQGEEVMGEVDDESEASDDSAEKGESSSDENLDEMAWSPN